MSEDPTLPPEPDVTCPEPGCGTRLRVLQRGWTDAFAGVEEPDAAVYTLACPNGHGQFQYSTDGALTPVAD